MRSVVGLALVGAACVGEVTPPAPEAEVDVGWSTPLLRIGPRAWRRSVADLLKTPEPADVDLSFLGDGARYETLADAQVEGDVVVDRFVLATEQVVERALRRPGVEAEAEAAVWEGGTEVLISDGRGSPWWTTSDRATASWTFDVPAAGAWTVDVSAIRVWRWMLDDNPPERPPVVVTITDPESGERVSKEITSSTAAAPDRVSLVLELPAGPHTLEVEITGHDVWGAAVDALVGTPVTPTLAPWFSCDGEDDALACARELLGSLTARAWSAPADEAALGSLVAMVEEALTAGDPFEDALVGVVERVLLSPRFLYRVERAGEEGGRPLDGYEVAGRLADLLWVSVPDDELLRCAAEGGLVLEEPGPCGLTAQVERMVADPRLDGFVDVLVEDWLGTSALRGQVRDPVLYAEFDDALVADMDEQARRMIASHVRDDRPFRELFVRPDMEVNARLAPWYGLSSEVEGWTSVTLSSADVGLLRQAAWLTATSRPERTSPVARGVAIASFLLCEPPGQPPLTTPALLPESEARGDVEARRDPACAGCHDRIDPWGFALEGFDAIGRPRTTYADGQPVSTKVDWLPEFPLDGLGSVGRTLHEDERVGRCFARELSQLAMGRSAGASEMAWVDDLSERLGRDASILDVVRGIALSPSFLSRSEVGP
jgi:hypothetical protein